MKKLYSFIFLIFQLHNSLNAQIISSSWDNCSKYLGNISRDLSSSNITTTPANWLTYWNQVTPSNAGKWGFVEGQRDVMKWDGLDKAYQLAKDNGLKFKQHTFIWGNQQPAWIENLSSEEQLEEIEEWISEFCSRYPNTDQIDVVNEARANKPDGGEKNNGTFRANYIDALGGKGDTGVDWVIKAFELARKYCPNAQLILNDYGILNNAGNRNEHIALANILKNKGLISNQYVFRLGVILFGNAVELKAGEFSISSRSSMYRIMHVLTEGQVVLHSMTIPEGLSNFQIYNLLANTPLLNGEITRMPREGSLLPETYNFPRGGSRDALILQMEKAMLQTLNQLWDNRAPNLPLKNQNEAESNK